MKREKISLDDSFEKNEQLSKDLAFQQLQEKAFHDDRVPSSLQNRGTENELYDPTKFNKDNQLDHRPSRDEPHRVRGQTIKSLRAQGKENSRDVLNIDESEDTIAHPSQMAKILERAKNLGQMMETTLENDVGNTWEQLHGKHVPPKKYIPPFLAGGSPQKQAEDDLKEELYDFEIGHQQNSNFASSSPGKTVGGVPQSLEARDLQQTLHHKMMDQENLTIGDMRYIKIKIG
jgi:hypothetical protein